MTRPNPPSDQRALSAEARRLIELAQAAGLGNSPDDALRLGDQALEYLGASGETPLLADALRWQGSLLRDCGRTSEAEPLYHRSLAVSKRIGYQPGVAHSLNCLGSLAQRRGDISGAASLVTEALGVADRCGDRRLLGMLQQNLGMFADIRGNPAAAIAHYRVALRLLEDVHDAQSTCWVLNNLGYLLVREDRFAEASEAFERGLGIARARGDLMAEGILEGNRAELHLVVGEIDEAYDGIRRSLTIAEQRTDDVRRAGALKLLGAYQRLTARPQEAVETFRHALTLSAVGEDAILGAEVLYQFGHALHDLGDLDGARQAWEAALDAFERISARQWVGRVKLRLSTGGTGRYL
jgi:tetratricopeptide (TPR) repeat protein